MNTVYEENVPRETYIGGSDISAILGLDPYRSSLSVYNDKLGLSEKEPMNDAMMRGIFLEDGIVTWYARSNDLHLGPARYTPKHPVFPFLMGKIDRTVREKGKDVWVVEAKTAGLRQSHKWSDPDDGPPYKVPLNYWCQANYYTGLMGLDRFVIVAYQAWREGLAVYPFDFHAEQFDFAVEKAATFWFDHIQTKTPPDVDVHRAVEKDLVRLYPEGTGESIVAPEDIVAMWSDALEAYRAKRTAEEKLREFKIACQAAAGDASVLEFPEGVVKIVDRAGSVSWKKAAEELFAVAAEYADMAGKTFSIEEYVALTNALRGKGTRFAKLPFEADDRKD